MLPSIVMEGNLTADPEMRYTPKGAAVVSFRVAANAYRKVGDEWQESASCFIECQAWERIAENMIEAGLAKGSGVLVTGELEQDTWETKDGGKRTTYRVRARSVGLSLKKWSPAKAAETVDVWAVGSETPPF